MTLILWEWGIVQHIKIFTSLRYTYSSAISTSPAMGKPWQPHLQHQRKSCGKQPYIPGAVGGTIDAGYIEAIWELLLEHACQISLLVQQHQPLSPAQLWKTSYAYWPCSNLQTKIVKVEDSNDIYIIEQQHIICHLVVFKNSPRTFGLTSETMTVCWGLNHRWRWTISYLGCL